MTDKPSSDALSRTPDAPDDRPGGHAPEGTGPTGTGTAADGTMGTAQTGPGAGQTGDDIDASGADTTGADMTGVGAASPGQRLNPGIAGDAPDEDTPGASVTPEGLS